MGWNSQSIRMHKPGGRRGNQRNRGFRTPERKERSPTERGVHRGSSPWTRSLGTFSGARESTSPAGARTGNTQCLPEPSGERAGFCLLFSREKSRSPFRAKLVVAKSAVLRFRPRAAKTALRSLAPPLPTETADAGFRRGPRSGGVKQVPVSIDRRTPADTPCHARRPLAFCRLALQSSAPPTGA